MRYRHTDTDLVRAARQQDFLREARQRVPLDDLSLGRNKLIDIFTDYTTSDISDAGTMLEVLKLFFDAAAPRSRRSTSRPSRPQLCLRDARRDPRRGRPVPRLRGERRPARHARRRAAAAGKRAEERRRAKKKKPRVEREAARQSTDSSTPRSAASWRRRASPARSASSSRSSTRPGCRRAPSTWKQPLRARPRPARLPPQGHRRQDRHGAYRMVLRRTAAATTSGCRGSAAGATRRSSATRA